MTLASAQPKNRRGMSDATNLAFTSCVQRCASPGTRMYSGRMNKGFTLIELAIVLAVAAIVVAGVLLASDSVVGRANIASFLSNIKDLATASREFKARYGYFPGDLPNAGTHITAGGGISGSCNYAPNSDHGNGIVNTSTESNCALEHLVKAGMLNKLEYDSSATQYYIKLPTGVAASIGLWFNSATNENALRIVNIRCDVAQEIERKFDNATINNKPFSQGVVTARDGADTVIDNCSVGGTNDPVATLLIKY